jgi:transcriptional regulator with XRE-family HTH domain
MNTGGRPVRSGNYTTATQHAARLLYEALGRNIERRRAVAGLTRMELARLARETHHAIEKAEHGGGMPIRTLFAIAAALGCTADDLGSA